MACSTHFIAFTSCIYSIAPHKGACIHMYIRIHSPLIPPVRMHKGESNWSWCRRREHKNHHISRCRHLSTRRQSNSMKNWLQYASNRGAQSMNVTNNSFYCPLQPHLLTVPELTWCIMYTHCAFCSCAQLSGQLILYERVKTVEMF